MNAKWGNISLFRWSWHNSSPVGSQQPPLQLGKLSSVCPACLSALVQEMELCQASEQRIELTVQATPELQVYFAANHMWTKAVELEVQHGTWTSCACRDNLSHGMVRVIQRCMTVSRKARNQHLAARLTNSPGRPGMLTWYLSVV